MAEPRSTGWRGGVPEGMFYASHGRAWSLRDYFAGQALAGMLAVGEEGTAEQIA